MVVLNWRLSLVIFLTVPLVTVATRYFGKKIRALSKNVQDKLADTTAIAEESLEQSGWSSLLQGKTMKLIATIKQQKNYLLHRGIKSY